MVIVENTVGKREVTMKQAFKTHTQNQNIAGAHFLQRSGSVFLLALFCNALWGSAFPSIKTGYAIFQVDAGDSASQIVFAGTRFLLAGILAILMGSIIQRKVLIPKKESLPYIGILSVFQTMMQYIFFYLGLAHTTGVKGSIISASGTFFAILSACLLFRQEKLTLRKLVACALGFCGVLVVNLTGEGLNLDFRLEGEGFLFISSFAGSIAACFTKIFSQKEDPVVLSGYQFILGGAIMIVCGSVMGGRLGAATFSGICILFYLAFISSAAFSIWGLLLKYNSVSSISIYKCTNPMFGVLLSTLILKEGNQASLLQIMIALTLVSVGIYVNASVGKKS